MVHVWSEIESHHDRQMWVVSDGKEERGKRKKRKEWNRSEEERMRAIVKRK